MTFLAYSNKENVTVVRSKYIETTTEFQVISGCIYNQMIFIRVMENCQQLEIVFTKLNILLMQNNIRKTNTMEFTCRIIKLIDNNELNM